MALDTERLMRRIEKKYPNLVNCLGNIDTRNRKCNRCRFIYECHLIQRELMRIEFAPGKYRPGFGRMVNRKDGR